MSESPRGLHRGDSPKKPRSHQDSNQGYRRRHQKKIIKQDQGIKERFQLLTSIPGIGEVTGRILLAELPDLSTFKCAKQLAAYAGLNSSIRTSGSSVRGRERMSKMGHALLRKTLFLQALSIMGRQTPLRPFIERLREKGKKGKVIVGAVMHKLLHIIFGVIKRQLAFAAIPL